MPSYSASWIELGPLEAVAREHHLDVREPRLELRRGLDEEPDALPGKQLAAGEDHLRADTAGRCRLPLSGAGLNRRRSVPLNTRRMRSAGRPGAQRVLPAVLGDGGERARVAKRPPQRRPNVPSGREIVALLRVHVHVAAVHGDHARQPQPSRGQHGGRARSGSPNARARRRRRGPGSGHRRPVLRLEIVRHDRERGRTCPAG